MFFFVDLNSVSFFRLSLARAGSQTLRTLQLRVCIVGGFPAASSS